MDNIQCACMEGYFVLAKKHCYYEYPIQQNSTATKRLIRYYKYEERVLILKVKQWWTFIHMLDLPAMSKPII